ncbi:glycine cleavage system protein H [Enterococcus hirae]|uniref:glycine cleavage system protein H n=1 Tax=Enterococcus hirae TaxID=1354 RepID=UPI0019F1D2D8|nr:glycine cleavage system protein H [Enterococcus hirae]EMF0080218.1 glycine cleavage system protein H [Enterococcus hirae]EMF0149607.1 glycine cleavage system protein H [Enterococcus hirae]EMF0191771.1 glycine cleavage system protein H [Enterococcus hirae]EMF0232585.1 glycine cleavage system protein H [Enterococcus hirae]EMF0240820.1 glycine cleavage system protein H [Enterococcus hirae]
MAGKHLKKKDNLWILFNGKEYCVGLTNEAQKDLGDITFANLPKAGQSYQSGEPLIEVEAEKAVSEFASPLSGTVSSVNEKINEDINVLNDQDEMNAWLLSFKEVDPTEFEKL